MKLIKRIRYQRVRLGSLDGGDKCTPDLDRGWRDTAHKAIRMGCNTDMEVIALDLNKYPPTVTWDIVGIPDEEVWHVDVWYEVFSGFGAAFDEFEEVYE